MDHVSIKDLKLFEINRELNHREIDRDFQETLDYWDAQSQSDASFDSAPIRDLGYIDVDDSCWGS